LLDESANKRALDLNPGCIRSSHGKTCCHEVEEYSSSWWKNLKNNELMKVKAKLLLGKRRGN